MLALVVAAGNIEIAISQENLSAKSLDLGSIGLRYRQNFDLKSALSATGDESYRIL